MARHVITVIDSGQQFNIRTLDQLREFGMSAEQVEFLKEGDRLLEANDRKGWNEWNERFKKQFTMQMEEG
jgi:hypothetical protein